MANIMFVVGIGAFGCTARDPGWRDDVDVLHENERITLSTSRR